MESVRLTPWASSLGIHLLLLALFLVFQLRAPVRPWGTDRLGDPTFVEVTELASVRKAVTPRVLAKTTVVATEPSVSSQAPLATNSGKTTETKPVSPTQSLVGSFGKADGTALSGELGSANGAKLSPRDRYLSDLRTTLEARKRYPSLSRRMSETGRVLVRFQISRSGQFSDITVLKSSGYDRLNSAAIALVQELGRYREFPESIADASLLVEIPIDYVLN